MTLAFRCVVLLVVFLFLISSSNHLSAQESQQPPSYLNSFNYTPIGKAPVEAISQIEHLIEQKDFDNLGHFYLVHNLGYAHFKANNKEQSVTELSKSINIAKTLDNFYQAKSLHRRALAYGILFRDTETALVDLKQALNIITQTEHQYSQELHFDLLTSLSQAYNQKADIKTARKYIEKALKLVQQPSAKEDKIYALVILGRLYWQENDIKAATHAYLSALSLTDENTSKGRIASIELRLAKVYYANGVLEQSLAHANKAIDIFTAINNKRSLINSIKLVGDIELKLASNINKAIMHYLNALEVAFDIDEKHSIGELEHLIGAAYISEGNLKQATKYLNAAKINLERSNEKYYSALNYIELAKLNHTLGNNAVAIQLLEQVLAENKLNSYPKALFEAKSKLAKFYQLNNQHQQAVNILKQQLAYLESQLDDKEANNVEQLNESIDVKMLETKFSQLKEQNEQLKVNSEEITQDRKVLSVFLIALLSLLIIFSYLLLTFTHKLKHVRSSTEPKWTIFLDKIKRYQQKIYSAKDCQTKSHGILVSIPKLHALNGSEYNHYQTNQALDLWHIKLSEHCNAQAKVKRLNESWLILENTPDQNELSTIQGNNELLTNNQHLIWLPLTYLPETLSEDSLVFIERLIYQIADIVINGDAESSYTKITMQDSVLAIIYKDNGIEELEQKISHALDTGLIQYHIQAIS